MKLLLVHPALPPERNPEGICTDKLIAALAAEGVDLTVLTGLHCNQWPGVNYIHEPGFHNSESFSESLHRWLNLFPEAGWGWAGRAARRMSALLRDETFDAVYTRGMPFVAHVAGLAMDRPAGLPWIAHFSDPWPDETHYGTRHSSWRLCWHARVAAAVDGLTFTCARIRDFCRERQWRRPDDSKPCLVLPHVFPIRELVPRISPPDCPMVYLHCGEFYGTRRPQGLVRGWAAFLREHPYARGAVRLRHVGPRSDELRVEAQAQGVLDTVEQLGPCDYEESLRQMHDADVLISVESTDSDSSMYLPSKIVDYLWFDRPILACTQRHGTVSELFGEDYPLRVDPREPEEIAVALAEVWCRRDSLEAAPWRNTMRKLRVAFEPKRITRELLEFIDHVRAVRGA